MTCVSCTKPTDRALCQQCTDDMIENMAEVVERYHNLDATPSSGGMDGGRRAPGFASKPPLKLHVAMLRDPRTLPRQLGDPHNAHAMLNDWANYIRVERQQTPKPSSIDQAAGYILANTDWLIRQDWVNDFRSQLTVVLGQLRSATGEPNPRPVGSCCGEALYWTLGEARCPGCDSTWNALDLLEQQLQAQEGA